MADAMCSINGCSKKVQWRQLCCGHYHRLLRYGDPLVDRRVRKTICTITDCGKVAASRGWCSKHYVRWKRHGDPLGRSTPAPRAPKAHLRPCPPDLPGEIWLPVPGFSGRYDVSDLGRVRSLPRRDHRGRAHGGLILKATPNSYGHRVVTLWRDGVPHRRFLHTLVLLAFVGPPRPGQVSRHGESGKSDNSLVNLCWGSAKENQGPDRLRDGTSNAGSRNAHARLTDDQVSEIRRLGDRGSFTHQAIANQFGVTRRTVGRILERRTWKYVA